MAIVRPYLDFWFARDVDGMEPTLSEDFILWHNHIGKKFGKSEMLTFIRTALEKTVKIEFRNQRWTVLSDSKLLLQHEMYVQMRDGQVLQDIPNAILYTLHDGKIAVIEEYVDGQAFAPLALA